jgi:hypothetical protein
VVSPTGDHFDNSADEVYERSRSCTTEIALLRFGASSD